VTIRLGDDIVRSGEMMVAYATTTVVINDVSGACVYHYILSFG
jgi:hypothetical protein